MRSHHPLFKSTYSSRKVKKKIQKKWRINYQEPLKKWRNISRQKRGQKMAVALLGSISFSSSMPSISSPSLQHPFNFNKHKPLIGMLLYKLNHLLVSYAHLVHVMKIFCVKIPTFFFISVSFTSTSNFLVNFSIWPDGFKELILWPNFNDGIAHFILFLLLIWSLRVWG